ncbi:MAG: flippase-like domain-containing protein [Gemmatimonadetes bacterium]|nr:flippase-like domain-containing protein [Gemmatimonadota bacterium]
MTVPSPAAPSRWHQLAAAVRHPVTRVALLMVAAWWIVRTLGGEWETMRASARELRVDWPWVGLASGIVLAVYAMLVQSWRVLLGGWGGALPYRDAVRIWTIANLGRWIPGKLWSIGALGVMAAEAGVSGIAAAGAALLGTLLNIGAGFGVMAITGASGLDAVRPGLRIVAILLGAGFVVGVLVLPSVMPRVIGRVAAWRKLPTPPSQLPARALWFATVANVLSWVGYGLAFACFARGVTPAISGNPAMFIAVFSASYLLGYLVLIAPGGLGVREVALVGLLTALGSTGQGEAVILSVTSRVWLIVLEVLPGLVSLLLLPAGQRVRLHRRP